MSAAGGAMSMMGTMVQLEANNQREKARGDAVSANLAMLRQQEEEILRRMEVNTVRMKARAEQERAGQTTAFAANGVDVGSGGPLALLADQELLAKQSIYEMRRDSEFKAGQIHSRRQAMTRATNQAAQAHQLNQFATFLGGGADVAKASGSFG